MTQKHKPKHVRPSIGRWVVISWLLTAVFLGMSYFYATHDSEFAFVVWFIVGAIWMYIAMNATTQYLKNRRNP